MATESQWRRQARQALATAVARGQAQGLAGEALEKFARKEGYPFGLRENTPYKLWCEEARRLFASLLGAGRAVPGAVKLAHPTNDPVRVLKLQPSHSTGYMLWIGRVTLGDWIAVWYAKGVLTATVGERQNQLRHGRPCFRESIAGPESLTCSLQEAAGILEASGLFDFSAIDLAACEGESVTTQEPPK